MNLCNSVVVLLFFSMSVILKADVFIGKIINDTDTTLFIEQTRLAGRCEPFKEIWVTENKNKPFKMNNLYSPLQPRTNYTFVGLNLPIQTVSNIYRDTCFLTISYAIGTGSRKQIIGFRQVGDLLQILKRHENNSLKELTVSGEKITISYSGAPFQILKEIIIDGAYYSIEIKQIVDKDSIFNKEIFDVIFNRMDAPSNLTFANKAEAKIRHFSPSDISDAVVIATVGFDELVSKEFLSKIFNALKENELIKRVGTIDMEESSQTIRIKLYTIISREEFNKIIDNINMSL